MIGVIGIWYQAQSSQDRQSVQELEDEIQNASRDDDEIEDVPTVLKEFLAQRH